MAPKKQDVFSPFGHFVRSSKKEFYPYLVSNDPGNYPALQGWRINFASLYTGHYKLVDSYYSLWMARRFLSSTFDLPLGLASKFFSSMALIVLLKRVLNLGSATSGLDSRTAFFRLSTLCPMLNNKLNTWWSSFRCFHFYLPLRSPHSFTHLIPAMHLNIR